MKNKRRTFSRMDVNSGMLMAKTQIDLVDKGKEKVWVLEHVFVDPSLDPKREVPDLMELVTNFIKRDGHKLWPLDPSAINFFQKNDVLGPLWYQKPFSEKQDK